MTVINMVTYKLCCNRILYCLVRQIGLMMSGFPKLDMIQEITGDSRSVKFLSLFLIAELNQNPVSSDVAAQCNQVNSYNFFLFYSSFLYSLDIYPLVDKYYSPTCNTGYRIVF